MLRKTLKDNAAHTCLKNNVAKKIITLNLVATSIFKKLYMVKTNNKVVVKIDNI